MPCDVFLSVGRASSAEQELFVQAVERCLLERDLRPRALGRGEWSSVQPLLSVEERMKECYGAVIVAFERIRVTSGLDLAGKASDERLDGQRMPTVWNQIEATLAYALGLPLLVIVEDGLRSEGLLEARYDWAVTWVPMEASALARPECLGVIDDWTRRVVAKRDERDAATPSETPKKTIGEKTVGEIVGELKPGQLRIAIAAAVSLLVAVAGVAFSLGAKLFA